MLLGKRLAIVCVLVLSACAPKVPPTYSAQAQRAANANQLIQELVALGQTAQNLNALPGGSPGRLSDADTAAVRDASLAINDAIPAYVSTGAIAGIQAGFTSLSAKITANTTISPTLKSIFALINTTVQLILAGVS